MTSFKEWITSVSMYNFYISCPMGLEKTLWDEISHKWQLFLSSNLPEPSFLLGGIEIETDMESALAINLFSKTANKVLLRIKKQKCRDVPKLFNIISKIKWKEYLRRNDIEWNITAHESRLFNSKKIEKTCVDAIQKYFNANQLPQKILEKKESFQKPSIYLRFDKDELTISLDTSGDLLHIRGAESFRGHASIRSTLASCLLWELIKDQNSFSLLDPMCGTGTFLKEAQNFYHLSTRKFTFQDWAPEIKINKILKDLPFENLYGFDLDKNVIKKCMETKSMIQFKYQDAFQLADIKTNNLIVICNPPYGKRIKLSRPRQVFYQELVDSLQKNYSPKRIGIILPEDIKLKQKSKKLRVFNSGIWLNFHIIK